MRLRVMLIASLVTALCLCVRSANAEAYTWTDKDGVTHFADNPPDDQPYKRRMAPSGSNPYMDRARDLAIRWEQASPYGGSCDVEEVRRVERLYQELYNEAQKELQFCKEGIASSCRALGIPTHLTLLSSAVTLQAYLPPPSIQQMFGSDWNYQKRKWNCR